MTSLRIVRFTQDLINSQAFIPWKVVDKGIGKISIPNLKINSTENMRKFHAYRTCNSRVIAHVLFLKISVKFWILVMKYVKYVYH